MTARAPRPRVWPVRPDGSLDQAIADRVDEAAEKFIDIVHGEGDQHDIARLIDGMGRSHLVGLAISIASQVPPRIPLPATTVRSRAGERRAVLDTRAAFVRGVLAGRRRPEPVHDSHPAIRRAG
ncbi:hypothetical protein [Nocardia sp. NPDC051570]|uniref:hypothetical protein n=1 Tax=Nocardia sp. NPDC051570 TaxID=3364324 RepID=UPI0037A21E35